MTAVCPRILPAGRHCVALWLVLFGLQLPAQVTDARVIGTVSDPAGQPVAAVTLTATNFHTGLTRRIESDALGYYLFDPLPPGTYTFTAQSAGYRGVERRGVILAVGERRQEDFTLTPSGVEQTPQEPFLIAPPSPTLPVETIASSVSVVVEQNKILQLPLESRNIYALFLLQPGVTSQGATVRRGLSFSVHGQRVSGSHYLLDGVDNNQTVLTGPVAAASADAVQEFRMVNSNFSAEYGRATSFVAQVVTRSGGNRLHGSLYEFLANDKLDANTFQNNSDGAVRTPLRRNQFGYFAGGPVVKSRAFFSSSLESSILRNSWPATFRLPSASFIAGLPQGSLARRLLAEIPPISTTAIPDDPDVGLDHQHVRNTIDTLLLTNRFDHHSASGNDRWMARYTRAAASQQDGEKFTGYPALMATDRFRAHSSLLAWTHSLGAGRSNDLRIGWSRERIALPQPRSDLPGIQLFTDVTLPGFPARFGEDENNNVVQLTDTFSWHRGRSALIGGFEYRRNLSSGLTAGLENQAYGGLGILPQGFYSFASLADFALGRPQSFLASVDRFSSGQLRLADLRRRYGSTDYAFFLQKDLKLTRRFSLNVGIRYEYFGVPSSTDGSRDVNFYFGPGSSIQERLASGRLRSTDQNSDDLKGLLYRRDRTNLAPVIGFAWDPFGRGRTAVRAGYGLALDRIFDTVRDLRTNTQQQVSCRPRAGCTPEFLIPIQNMLPRLNLTLPAASVIQLDENLRTPYAQNWYGSVQHEVASNLVLEVGHSGSVGRKLISRDFINRSGWNSTILNDTYLSNSGNSNCLALEVSLRRPFSRGLQYQVSYTYSHAIDNQSDILEGPRTGPESPPGLASFTREFDPRVDRGNANFDQRHNLIFNAIWDVPRVARGSRWPWWLVNGWTISGIGGHRTGFPLTVISSVSAAFAPGLRNNRPDFVGTSSGDRRPVPGGVEWLAPNQFRAVRDRVGNLGRGALRAPGFRNYDLALLRNVGFGEGRVRLQFRAEFYNAFNHANLSAPVTLLTNPSFGRAYYGLNRTFSRFGDLLLENPARRIQFGLRFQF